MIARCMELIKPQDSWSLLGSSDRTSRCNGGAVLCSPGEGRCPLPAFGGGPGRGAGMAKGKRTLKRLEDDDYDFSRKKKTLVKVNQEGQQRIVEPPVRPAVVVALEDATITDLAAGRETVAERLIREKGFTLPTAAGVGMGLLVLLVTVSVSIVRRRDKRSQGQVARLVRRGGGATRGSSRSRWVDTREEEYNRLEEARAEFVSSLRRDDLPASRAALDRILALHAGAPVDSWYVVGAGRDALEEQQEWSEAAEYRDRLVRSLQHAVMEGSEEELVPSLEHIKCERQLVGEAEAEALLQQGRERLAAVYVEEDRDLQAQLRALKDQCGLHQRGGAGEQPVPERARRALEYGGEGGQEEEEGAETVVEESSGASRMVVVEAVEEVEVETGVVAGSGEETEGVTTSVRLVSSTSQQLLQVLEEEEEEEAAAGGASRTATAMTEVVTRSRSGSGRSSHMALSTVVGRGSGGESMESVSSLIYFQSVVQRMSMLETSLEGRRVEREKHRRTAKHQAEMKSEARRAALQQRLMEMSRRRLESEKARRESTLSRESDRRRRDQSFLVYLLAANLITVTLAAAAVRLPAHRSLPDLVLSIPYYRLFYGDCQHDHHQPQRHLMYRPGAATTGLLSRLGGYLISSSVACHVEKTLGLLASLVSCAAATWLLGTLGVENRARILVGLLVYCCRSLCLWLTLQGVYHIRFLLALHAPLQLLVPLLDSGRDYRGRRLAVYVLLPLASTVVALACSLAFIDEDDYHSAARRLAESAMALVGARF